MELPKIIIDVPEILRRSDIKPGDVVADLGTGREGRMAIPAGQIIGDSGIAYAVDVVKAILPAVQAKARMRGVNNVQTIWSDLEVFGATRAIRDNTLTIGYVVTTLFQSSKREAMLRECHRMVRPGGKLVAVDWKPGAKAPLGPEEARRVHPEEIKAICEKLNMHLVDEFSAGPYHWGLIFVK
jgi:ubiquinone/menaquinone biosynthesis C-methylase UbiE